MTIFDFISRNVTWRSHLGADADQKKHDISQVCEHPRRAVSGVRLQRERDCIALANMYIG